MFAWVRVGCAAGDVCDEGMELFRDRNWWKHEMCGGIYATGGTICRVGLARDVSGEDGTLGFISSKMYALEDFITGAPPVT